MSRRQHLPFVSHLRHAICCLKNLLPWEGLQRVSQRLSNLYALGFCPKAQAEPRCPDNPSARKLWTVGVGGAPSAEALDQQYGSG